MKNIIIVEDEIVLSRILKYKFEEEGWSVDTAFDGEEALEKLNKNKYDILLLDLLMPKVDGFEVIEKLKSNNTTSHISIIVMSNLGDEDIINKAFNLGVKDYFIKNQHLMKKIVERAEELVAKQDSFSPNQELTRDH